MKYRPTGHGFVRLHQSVGRALYRPIMAASPQKPATEGSLARAQIPAKKNHLRHLRPACNLPAQRERRRLIRQQKFSEMGQGLCH